ncbi:MAG: sigma 54-interacting transcriptional regulator [Polyangiaceae bacterium]|nr:sigma 54-interacting transcriptional regulator [Polyangiaceae bacterium]
MTASRDPSPARLQRERDLFLSLLSLSHADDVRPYVGAALELLVRATGAQQGYVEVYGADEGEPAASVACGMSGEELDGIRARMSQGIVKDAISSGATVSTASAIDDPRFAGFASVQAQRLRAVLCAPLVATTSDGAAGARVGVLYLEGRSAPGPFPEDDRALVEVAARALAPNVERLLWRSEAPAADDPTAEIRARLGVTQIIGRSRALAEVLRQLHAAAQVPVAVLLRGESGTGKSALARALHEASPRKVGPFVELNVAALPEALFESELFGAEKGAHSQATTRLLGKVDAAQGGTLFLDEIGELSLVSQAKLLSFLQDRSYMRLGGTTKLVANVRVIAATNADLEEAVRERRFRQDLYYRLNVLEIVVPAARATRRRRPDRRGDRPPPRRRRRAAASPHPRRAAGPRRRGVARQCSPAGERGGARVGSRPGRGGSRHRGAAPVWGARVRVGQVPADRGRAQRTVRGPHLPTGAAAVPGPPARAHAGRVRVERE